MYWCTTPFVDTPYQGVNWIHPLKQHKVEELLYYVQENYPAMEFIVVFGSSIRGDCNTHSDIDIAIYERGGVRKFIPPDNDKYDIIYIDSIRQGTRIYNEVIEKGVVVLGDYSSE